MLMLGCTLPFRSSAAAMAGRRSASPPPTMSGYSVAAVPVPAAHDDLELRDDSRRHFSLILFWPSCCWPLMSSMAVLLSADTQLLHWNPTSCIISRELSWEGITGEAS
jgi:hypothetical protein